MTLPSVCVHLQKHLSRVLGLELGCATNQHKWWDHKTTPAPSSITLLSHSWSPIKAIPSLRTPFTTRKVLHKIPIFFLTWIIFDLENISSKSSWRLFDPTLLQSASLHLPQCRFPADCWAQKHAYFPLCVDLNPHKIQDKFPLKKVGKQHGKEPSSYFL